MLKSMIEVHYKDCDGIIKSQLYDEVKFISKKVCTVIKKGHTKNMDIKDIVNITSRLEPYEVK